MNAVALHEMAERFERAFTEEVVMTSTAQRIVELAGAQWVGVQPATRPLGGPLVMFRDPVTTSTLALPEDGLSLFAVQEKMRESRAKFGVVPS
jgi:hypothetical protein